VVTSLDQFKGLYKYLKQHNMVPSFLAHGQMALVRKVIVETDLLKSDCYGRCGSIYDAIALSLKEDRHERVANLFEAARERPDWKYMFSSFVEGFFRRYSPEKNSTPLKRFLTLHGEEFSERHPEILENVCQRLVFEVSLDGPVSQKLLTGLVGQPSLLTPVAFVWGFLRYSNDTNRANFIKYGYKEAIEEGLREEYPVGGGRKLWKVMVSKYPTQFSGEYPDTDEERRVALKDLPTKQDLEEEWALANAPSFLLKLKTKLQESDIFILLPSVLWNIVVGYAETGATWVDVEDTAPPPVPDNITHSDSDSDSDSEPDPNSEPDSD